VLVELRLENYAVIDNVAVEFAAGLNLLTGETGAGKSILIDALALLLGDKASSDVIRSGADRAIVASVFELDSRAGKVVKGILATNGIDPEEETIILRVARAGFSSIINRLRSLFCGSSRRISPPSTHRTNPFLRLMGLPVSPCSMLLQELKLNRPRKRSPNGRPLAIASRNWSETKPIASVCSISGASRKMKSRTQSLKVEKMSV